MATASKTETITITLTLNKQEADFLRGYLTSTSGILKDIKEALAGALAPF